jgi:transposase, IS30 family
MQYHQITSGERYAIAALRRRGLSLRAIARNRSSQGRYTPTKADSYAHTRRRRSRRGSHLTADDWALGEELLALDWSPEQVAGWLRRHELLAISHETIYVRVWHEKRAGGELWTHLRQAGKQRRKRYGAYDSRGRLAASATSRSGRRRPRRSPWSGTGRPTR